jgi:hypothetical protein
MLPHETKARALIAQFRAKGYYSVLTIGYAEVRIDSPLRDGGPPTVDVNWPGIGAQRGEIALAFANDLACAALIALTAERIIADEMAREQSEGA